MSFNFIDLFCGAGGFTLGLVWAGGSPVTIGIDSDEDCAETFALNFPEASAIVQDIRDVDFSAMKAEAIVAGPPCQGFSALNRNRKGDRRNGLCLEVIRCVETVRPAVVVLENVPQFLEAAEGRDFIAQLREIDYTVKVSTLNCADYGVPQKRVRALVSAVQRGLPAPLARQTHSGNTTNDLRPHRTVGEALAFLPPPNGRNWHRPYSERPKYEERFRAIPAGGARKHLPPDLTLECWNSTRGFSDVMGRLQWHRPANTIRTEFFRPEKGRFLHPVSDRPITVREAARLQSFPDNFIFPESHTLASVGRQVGNAMPPLAAKAIGLAIEAVLSRAGGRTKAPRASEGGQV